MVWTNESNGYTWTGGTTGNLAPLLKAVEPRVAKLVKTGGRFVVLVPWRERNCLMHRLNYEDPTLRRMGLVARYRGLGDSGNYLLESAKIVIQGSKDGRLSIALPSDSRVDSASHDEKRFKTVVELEHQYASGTDDTFPQEKSADLKLQCEDWNEAAQIEFAEHATAGGSDWTLIMTDFDHGAYLEQQAGWVPCVRVRGIMTRGEEQRSVVLWYTWPRSFHQGFPQTA